MKRFHQQNTTLGISGSPPILPYPDLKTPPEREYDCRIFRRRFQKTGTLGNRVFPGCRIRCRWNLI